MEISNAENQFDKNQKIKNIILIFGILIVLFIMFFSKIYRNIPKVKVESLENISEPIQTDYSDTIYMDVKDSHFKIDRIAKYEITGRILEVHKFFRSKILSENNFNNLSPLDLGIGWGKLSPKDSYSDILEFYSLGSRFLYFKINDISKISVDEVSNSFSNNHIIPANKKIEKQALKIRKNDYVKIEGYLVNVYQTIDNKNFYWTTSTSRNDTGDGACEIIYVTNITLLKEK